MSYTLDVVKGDITKVTCDAIVNAANSRLWMGSGVAGAIKAAGGKVIEEEAMTKGPIMPGEAVFTGAGQLPFKIVIHAAVMGQDLRTSDRIIRQATVAVLNIAEAHKIESLAFPAFGTGVGGFPMKACANLMVTTVIGYQSKSHSLKKIIFCLYDEYGFKLFSDRVGRIDRG